MNKKQIEALLEDLRKHASDPLSYPHGLECECEECYSVHVNFFSQIRDLEEEEMRRKDD